MTAIAATHSARLYILRLALPLQPQGPAGADVNAGVLLEDPATGALHLRLRRDWEAILPEDAQEEVEVLSELEFDLETKAAEMGAARLMAHLQDSLSNSLQISEPREVIVEDFARALNRQYRQHVQPVPLPFRTHLPKFSLSVAAGSFLENKEVTEDGWEEAPSGLRLTEDMFVARIAGRSMEPRIPDGSLCVFRSGVTGSRQGRLVLVEYLGGGANDRYTVKKYYSEKVAAKEEGSFSDASWGHQRIRLEPLNPEFDAWDLDPEEDRFRIVAEFVQVLE